MDRLQAAPRLDRLLACPLNRILQQISLSAPEPGRGVDSEKSFTYNSHTPWVDCFEREENKVGNRCMTRSTNGRQWIKRAVEAQELCSQTASLCESSYPSRQMQGGSSPKLNLSAAVLYQFSRSSPHYSVFYYAQRSKCATCVSSALI